MNSDESLRLQSDWARRSRAAQQGGQRRERGWDGREFQACHPKDPRSYPNTTACDGKGTGAGNREAVQPLEPAVPFSWQRLI